MARTVWVLSSFEPDAEQEEWEQLDTIYSSKPSKETLEAHFKYHQLRPGFVDELLSKGEVRNSNSYSYDNWHYSLEEIECI